MPGKNRRRPPGSGAPHLFARNRRFCREKTAGGPRSGAPHCCCGYRDTAAVATRTLLLLHQIHVPISSRGGPPLKHFRADLQNTWVWGPGMALDGCGLQNKAGSWSRNILGSLPDPVYVKKQCFPKNGSPARGRRANLRKTKPGFLVPVARNWVPVAADRSGFPRNID